MANTKLPARLLDTSAVPTLNVTGDLTVDTTTLKVDSTNNRIGVGVASPSAPIHIQFSNNDGGVGGQLIKNTNTGTTSNFASLSTQAVNGTIQGTFGSAHYSSWGNAVVFAGSQSNHPFKIIAGNAVRATFDTNGNVGIGTTPETWKSGWEVLRIGERASFYSQASTTTGIGENVYYDNGSNWRAIANAPGSLYQLDSGNHHFYTMASVSAGAVSTPSEKFTILQNGNVGIGTASPPSPLSIFGLGTSSPVAANAQQSYDNALFRINNFGNSSVGLSIGSTGSNVTHIQTSYNEGTTSPLALNPFGGNISIGTTSSAVKLRVQDTADSQILIYETGASPYTATLKLASQSTTAYGANVQYTSQAEELTIENFGRALSAASTSGSIRFRTKVGNSSMTEVMRLQGHTGAVTTPQQPYAQLRGNGGWSDLTNGSWDLVPKGTPVMIRNQGSHYNTSTKRFTCPVAGNYMVTVSHYIYHPSTSTRGSQYVHPGVYKNGASTWNSGYHPYTIFGHNENTSGTTHFDGVGYSYVLFCAANDYLETRIFASGTNNKTYDQYTYTSYILLG